VREYFTKLFEITPTLAPMMALRWFGGIRPKATTLMAWEDINFEARRIGVREEINKMREPDIIENLPDQIWHWLASFRATGRIADPNYRKLTVKLHHALGYGKSKLRDVAIKRWPEDVARHSFASHALPLYGIERVRSMLLHAMAEITLKHYLVLHVTIEEAKAYQSILPEEFPQKNVSPATAAAKLPAGSPPKQASPKSAKSA
jgi:integrase